MKKQTTWLLIAYVTALLSCGYYAKHKYGLQQNRDYKNPTQYLHDIEKRNLFNRDEIYYVDSAHYISFFNSFLAKDSTIIYVGCVVGDSSWLKKSEQLLDNGSCKGRLDNEIDYIVKKQQWNPSEIVEGPSLLGQGLFTIADNLPYQRSKNKKELIISYSYLFGKYYDVTYKKMVQKAQENGVSVKVVVLDPVYRLVR